MRVLVSLALLLAVAHADAAPAPKAKPKPLEPTRSFEIDFTPLGKVPPGRYDWRLDIHFKVKDAKVGPLTFTGVAEPGEARFMVIMCKSAPVKGLVLAPDKSGAKLIVKAAEGSPPLLSVEVSLKGFDQSHKPKVTRLPK